MSEGGLKDRQSNLLGTVFLQKLTSWTVPVVHPHPGGVTTPESPAELPSGLNLTELYIISGLNLTELYITIFILYYLKGKA